MSNVIGPIDLPTWYSMRQCQEAIKWCKQQHNPVYDIEIKGEQQLLQTFKDQIFGRKAA